MAGSNFFKGGGVQLLIPYRIPYNLCFSGGGVQSPCPPLDQCMQYFAVTKVRYEKKLSILTPPLGIPTCIHGVWENNHSGLTRIQIVFELFNGSAVVKCLTGD